MRYHKKFEDDGTEERATLRRERMQILDRVGSAAELVTASIASGDRGNWAEVKVKLETVQQILQIVLDEASDRVLLDDASQERADLLARTEKENDHDEERFND